jgi:hypothetical protein
MQDSTNIVEIPVPVSSCDLGPGDTLTVETQDPAYSRC